MNIMLDQAAVRQKSRALSRLLAMHLPFALPAYLIRFSLGGFPTTLLELYLAALLVAFTIAYGKDGWRRAGRELGRWRMPVLLWAVSSFAAVFWSPDIFSGMGLWRAYVLEPLLIFFVLRVELREEKAREFFTRHLYFITIGIAAWAAVQFASGQGIPHPWNVSIADGRRATGPFPFPNAVALFVVPVGAYAAAVLSKRRDLFAGIALCASFLAVLLAKSDGGLIALSAAFAFTLLFTAKGRRIFGALLILAALVFAIHAPLRQKAVAEVTFKTWPGQVRLTIWEETWNMLRNHPVRGAGFAGYPTVFADFHKATYIEIFQYPHNIVLNTWSETGIFGLFAFAYVIWIWATWRSPEGKWNMPALAVLIALLVHGLVDVPYFKNDLAVLFWVLALLTTSPTIDVKTSRG